VEATIYVIPGSHPSMTGRLMLEHKGIAYRRIDLVSVLSRPILRALGFPGVTVPAVRIDGRRLQRTRVISQALDELRPDPPLFPREPERRATVEEAERWGDEVFQPVPRRLVWWALRRDRSGIGSFLADARLGIPTGLAARTALPIILAAARLNGSTDAAVREDLAALPGMLDRVDGWIDEGVLGGEERSAADFQIATTVRLLMCFDDLRPEIERRPAGDLAMRIVPSFPGRVGPVLPAAWLEPLHAAQAARA
jgi:glutathione S-transferase